MALAPHPHTRVRPWINIAVQWAITTIVDFSLARMIQVIILLSTGGNDGGGYSASKYEVIAIHGGILLLHAIINSLPISCLSLLGRLAAAWNILADERLTYEKWERSNRMSLMIIKHSISETIRGAMPEEENAKKFLSQIADRFVASEKVEACTLLSKLVTMRYNGKGNIREYIMEMSNIVAKMKALKLEFSEDILNDIEKPLRIYRDNKVVELYSKNDKSLSKSKDIDIKFLVIKERVQNHLMSIEYISTKLLIADPFTKGLPPKAFKEHIARAGVTEETKGADVRTKGDNQCHWHFYSCRVGLHTRHHLCSYRHSVPFEPGERCRQLSIAEVFHLAFKRRYGNGAGGIICQGVAAVGIFFCGMSLVTSNSRMVYAFSRDGAMPLSSLWHKVNKQEVPTNAVWLSAFIAFCMALTVIRTRLNFFRFSWKLSGISRHGIFNNNRPLPCLRSPNTLQDYIGSQVFRSGPFNLGRYGVLVSWIAVLWVATITVLFSLPVSYPITDQTLNYTPVAVGLLLLLTVSSWIVSARHWFKGPITNINS
ncbi:hypothetical protein RHSIM_Rhsim09G0102700 [Rhododendron simsii]|uniref:Uncharacterized protein n=1 Tax=Rhododendron simsii TaxID=118357 RepID=A0A834GFH1_RHOSS|nr:hypothetical protein RHSIM_Rhsim09G0102700 [Rhododendron simsii]